MSYAMSLIIGGIIAQATTIGEKPWWAELAGEAGGWAVVVGVLVFCGRYVLPKVVEIVKSLIQSIDGLKNTFENEARQIRAEATRQGEDFRASVKTLEEEHRKLVTTLINRTCPYQEQIEKGRHG